MVELVRAGRSPEELAKEFEPSANAIRNWAQQADRDEGRRDDGLTTAEREELRRLRKELRQVREASDRAKANATLLEEIEKIHDWSDGTYGAVRITEELKARGRNVSVNRVARLVAGAGLQGASRRKGTKTTLRGEETRPAPDLVDRNFTATGPDQLWVADITYIPTWAGFLYLAVVLDVWSRRVVGWGMATHLRTELVLDALNMALWQRRPVAVIHHSDQGSQYTSLAFGRRCVPGPRHNG
jgi:putative transposase